jgi:phage terminase large subunit-like protein
MSEDSPIDSPIVAQIRRLVRALGPDAACMAVSAFLKGRSNLELAAMRYYWPFWARPSQLIPPGGWRSCGLCAGRGAGKTRSVVSYALQEIEAGHTRRVALVGQNEDKCVAIFITGESGFLELSPPWFRPVWEVSTKTLRFPNGAIATVYGATEPDNLRGPQHDLALCTEVSHWPRTTGPASLANLRQGLRLGEAKLLWDTTPRRRDPIMRALVAEHEADPERHRIIFGSTADNRLNLAAVAYAEFESLRDTAQGQQEFHGRPSNDLDNGMFNETDMSRPHAPPAQYTRRILAIDPSTAGKKHSDEIGIVEAGLSAEGICFILSNLSGKHDINFWPDLVLDRYRDSRCDLVLIETNHAGTTWAKIFSDACKLRGWRFHGDISEDATPHHEPGALNFRAFSVSNRQNKAERAQSAANWVRAGKVSFVEGALGALKEQLADFSGDDNRPDDQVDAFVHAVNYLLRLEAFDPRSSIAGIGELQRQLSLTPERAAIEPRAYERFRSQESTWRALRITGRGDRI